MSPRKAKKIHMRSSDKPQVKARHRQDEHETWLVAVDYQSVLRIFGSLARCAARGVTAAEKALDDLAKNIVEVRRNPNQPGSCLFGTGAEWKAFLDNKIAEWGNRADPPAKVSRRSALMAVTPSPEQLQAWFDLPSGS